MHAQDELPKSRRPQHVGRRLLPRRRRELPPGYRRRRRLLYEMAVSDFNEVARELLPRKRGGSHDSAETWKYGHPLQQVRQQNDGYLHCFSRRVKELQPFVNAARAVRQANREQAQVLADLRGWEARYREHQEAMSAREEQQLSLIHI